jgi:hypothetical protein
MAPPPPPAPTAVGADPLHSGNFVMLDRFDMTNRVGLEATYVDVDGNGDGNLFGFNLHGSYIDPASHFGGYASVPLAAIVGSDHDDTGTIGNIEAGALYAAPINEQAGVVVRVGGVFPTAPDDNTTKIIANAYSGYARPGDLALAVPNAKGVRLSASPMYRSGKLFARVDAGVDIVWMEQSGLGGGTGPTSSERGTFIHAAGGIGADLQSVQIMGELGFVNVSSENSDSNSTENLAISARIPSGQFAPYAALILPLDSDVNKAINLFLTVGFDAKI